MRKALATFLIIILVGFVISCANGSSEDTVATTETISIENRIVSKHLELGDNIDINEEILQNLREKYNFEGNRVVIFEIDFLEDVEITYKVQKNRDYPLIREATVVRTDSNTQPLFEYIVEQLEEYCVETTLEEYVEGTTFYRDDNGNIIKVVDVSNSEVKLSVVRAPNIWFGDIGSVEHYFVFSGDNIGTSLEAVRTKIIEGCPSSTVSEIEGDKFTYTYMGYTFMISDDDSLFIDGQYSYHRSITD